MSSRPPKIINVEMPAHIYELFSTLAQLKKQPVDKTIVQFAQEGILSFCDNHELTAEGLMHAANTQLRVERLARRL